MKSNLISAALLTALFCAVSGWAAQETPPGELFSGKILEKKLPAGASLTRDPATGLPGVRIDRGNTGADFRFPISEDTAGYRIRFRVRCKDVVKGELGWQKARLDVRFLDASGKKDVTWVEKHDLEGTRGWQSFDDLYPVPREAKMLWIIPANYGKSGEVEFADLSVVPLDRAEYEKQMFKREQLGVNLLTRENVGAMKLPAGMTVSWNNDKPTFKIDRGSCTATLRIPIPQAFTQIPKDRPAVMLRACYRIRTDNVVRGKLSWQNARLDLQYLNREGRQFGPYLQLPTFLGTNDWRTIDEQYSITPGAAFLAVIPTNYGAEGSLEIADVELSFVREQRNLEPPDGSTAEQTFSLDDAWKVEVPGRGKICLNGLWRFQPVFDKESSQKQPAAEGWGWFKVPASWPGANNWQNNHIFYLPGRERDRLMGEAKNQLHYAWYERDIRIPSDWQGRRIKLDFELFQGIGTLYVDNRKVGDLSFPGGEVDITDFVKPGENHKLLIYISTEPRETSHFMGMTREYKDLTEQSNKGICGDVYLLGVPAECEISDVRIVTSVKKKEISFDTGFARLPAGTYTLEAEISDGGKPVKTFISQPFRSTGKPDFRHTFTASWNDPKLWDTDTPENVYTLNLQLKNAAGKTVDHFFPEEFGFREFELQGRNFVLNGKPIHLRALPINNTAYAADSTRDKIEHLARAAKAMNINFLFDGDRAYNFRLGTNAYDRDFRTILSRNGILTSLALPHAITDFQSKLDDPAVAEAYRKMATYRIRRYQNVPGIVLYSTSHNALGHADMQNPSSMGTDWRPEHAGQTSVKRQNGLLAEKIINSIDPTRPVYHHDGGNLGHISAQNFYLNWVPMQERSDWLELWEKNGTMPIIFVEYGVPHVASWSSNRGPLFIWRAPEVQGTWLDEFNAETVGEEAYVHTPRKMQMFRREYAAAKNNTPTRFLTSGDVLRDESTDKVRAEFLGHNLRDMRARGLSGFQPWDHSSFHNRVSPAKTTPNPDRFRNLKQPGSTPDRFVSTGYILTDPYATYEPNLTGAQLELNYRPLLAWISGKPGDFTEQSRHFRPGETVEKSLTILNDTRHPRTIRYSWKVDGISKGGNGSVEVAPAGRAEIPIRFQLPADAAQKKEAVVTAQFDFGDDNRLEDSFQFMILPEKRPELRSRVGLWDPEKTAKEQLDALGVKAKEVRTAADLEGVDLLVIGRYGLEKLPFNLAPALQNGLRLLVLEQKSQQLNDMGLRYAEHGLRRLFPVGTPGRDLLTDWRGSSTTRPYFPPGTEVNTSYPKGMWNGFLNTHIWYCGQRGNVADILLEKPTRGNWLPLYHGGFDLQYAPLILFREGKAKIMLCQLDVSGRTETEPQARNVLAEALEALDRAETPATRPVRFAGKEAGELLELLRVPAEPLKASLDGNELLVAGPGAELPGNLRQLIEGGLNVLALGWSKEEIHRLAPDLPVEEGTFYTDLVKNLDSKPEFAGLCNADLHLRYEEPFASFPVDSEGGRLLQTVSLGKGKIVFYQMPPFRLNQEEYIKRTTVRRSQYTTSRLLANLGAAAKTDFAGFFSNENRPQTTIRLDGTWLGIEDPKQEGRDKGFFKPEFRADNWRKVQVPGTFDTQFKELSNFDGYFWYRRTFDLPESMAATALDLGIGPVDDESWVWLDGKFLGEVTKKTNPNDYWLFKRSYKIPAGTLKPGRHTVVVLCNDTFNTGGITGIPRIGSPETFPLYADRPIDNDDPYRYFHW